MPAGGLVRASVAIAVAVVVVATTRKRGVDGVAAMAFLRGLSEKLGPWALPLYVASHALTIALCLPYAVFLEAGASVLFGFFPAVISVVFAKSLGASLSFLVGRAIFRSSKSAMEWATGSRYFHLIARGVKRDGWKFVLLARFSPLPSYVINYALAATEVGFLVDFLLPTIVGCLPMILQNISIGSLAGAAVSSTAGSGKTSLSSYFFPLLGIASSILISLRIKKYSSDLSVAKEFPSPATSGAMNGQSSLSESPSPAAAVNKFGKIN